MKLKELEGYLQQVTPFEEFDYMLEQYPTSPHLAARILFTISSVYDDIDGMLVGDFGCGGGMLGFGAAMLGAGAVLGLDIDPKAIGLARRNAIELDLAEETDFVLVDVAQLAAGCKIAATDPGSPGSTATKAGTPGDKQELEPEPEQEPQKLAPQMEGLGRKPRLQLDTVVMNPPFGTRNKGIDAIFLRHAIQSVRHGGAVYSLHKSSTRAHLFSVGVGLGAMPEVVAQLRFDIPRMYAFHTQDSADVDVDLLRFVVGGMQGQGSTEVHVPEYLPEEEEDETEGERRARRAREGKEKKGGGARTSDRRRSRGRGQGPGGRHRGSKRGGRQQR